GHTNGRSCSRSDATAATNKSALTRVSGRDMAARAIQGDWRHGGKPIGTKVFGFSTGSKNGSAGPCWIEIHPVRSAIAHYRGSDSLLARLIAIFRSVEVTRLAKRE